MNKYDIKILKNGLRIIYCLTPKKNIKYASLKVDFGGFFDEIKYDNTKIKIKKGYAHLLEHFIIEDSKYGNYLKYLSEKNVDFNGSTSPLTTSFYFSCVFDFEEHLKELIQVVNNPNFKNLEEVKGAIIEEIKQGEHREYNEYNKVHNKQLMNTDFFDNIGSIKYIKNSTIEELKQIYDLVYKPENQILLIRGNFNINEIVKIIENEYDKINKPNPQFELVERKHDDVYSKREVVNLEKEQNLITLTFKWNRDNFTDDEFKKLAHYYGYYIHENYIDFTDAYNKLIKNKYTLYSIGNSVFRMGNYLFFSLYVYSSYEKEVLDILFDTINNFKYDQKSFDLWKRKRILNFLIDENNPNRITSELYENYKSYNYIGLDKIDFLESLNLDECVNLFKKLDYTNYAITVGVKEDENN